MTVTVGAYSLIVPDPNEQYIPALSMKVHESYNAVTKLNDIALIQVQSRVKSLHNTIRSAAVVLKLHYTK